MVSLTPHIVKTFGGPKMSNFTHYIISGLLLITSSVLADDVPGTYRDYDEDGARQEARQVAQVVERERSIVLDIERDTNTSRERLRRLNLELTRLQEEFNSIDQRAQEKRQEIQQKQRQISTLESEIQTLRNQIPQLQRQQNQAQQNLNSTRNQLSNSQNQLRNEKQKLTQLEQEVVSRRNAMAGAQERVRVLQGEVSQLQQRVNSLNTQNSTLVNEISRLTVEIQRTQASISTLETEIPRLKGQLAQSEKELQNLNNQIHRLNIQIKKAEEAGDKELVKKLMAKRRPLLEKREKLKSHIANLNTQISNKTRQLAQLQRKLPQLQSQLNQKKSEQRQVQTQLAQANRNLNQKKTELAQAQNQLQPLQQAFQRAKQARDTQAQVVSSVESEISSLQRQIVQLERKIQSLISQISEAQNQINLKTTRIQTIQQKIAKLEREIQTILASKPRVQREINQTQQSIQTTQRELDVLVDRLRQARTRLAGSEARLRDAQNWIQQVRRNIENAQSIANRTGERHGEYDGTREGQEVGEERGTAEGIELGEREGRSAGTQAGRQRSYERGQSEGNEKGHDDGFKKAGEDAQINGEREGSSEGQQAGLRVAYQNGYQRGQETANDSAAYAQGKKEGLVAGLEKARAEAKPLEASAYNKKETEYRSAPLKEVTTKNLAHNFQGLQSTSDLNDDGRYYNPRPPRYPHPMIRDFYMESYDYSYREHLRYEYNRAFERAYNLAYERVYSETYQRYANQDYPQERERGYNEAYRESYQRAYDQTYPSEFQRIKKYYYDYAFEQYKENQDEMDRGYREGNQFASHAKGFNEGIDEGYRSNIEREKNLAVERGIKRATEKYTQNAVLEFVASSISDENKDGLFVPGEKVLISLTVKNFGWIAKSGLKSNSGIQASQSTNGETSLPVIGGQTKTNVTVAGQVTLSPNLKIGETAQLKFSVKDLNREIYQNRQSLVIKYPVEISLKNALSVIEPGKSSMIELSLSNVSKTQKSVVVEFSTHSNLLEIDSPTQSIELRVGRSESVVTKVIASDQAFFDPADLLISVSDNKLVAAKKLERDFTIGYRHEVNRNSQGLLLGSNLSVIASRDLYQKSKLDTYDIRVDGGEIGNNLLNEYKGKVIHIISSRELSKLSQASVLSLIDFAKSGGNLVFWNASDELPQNLKHLLGLDQTQRTQVLSLKGLDILTGFEMSGLNTTGMGLTLDSMARPILVDGDSILGSQVVFSPLTDQPGRALALGFTSEVVDTEKIQLLLTKLLEAATSFEKKINDSKSNPAIIASIIFDIQAEIKGDDLDTSVRWYKDKKKETKMFRAIKKVLKNKNTRPVIAKFYPQVLSEIHQMQDKNDQQSALNVLKTGAGGFSQDWKSYYCKFYEDNDTHGICR